MKKLIALTLALTALLGVVFSINANAGFGAAIDVMTENEGIIKTGLFGKKFIFKDTDFKQGLAIEDFDSITVTKLPSSTEGTLMLAGRRVSEGMKIRRKNIGALVFIPASKDVAESKFYFTISPYADENEIKFTLKFTDKINYEPEIDNTAPTSIMTQRDVSIWGNMSAKDKEGDKISYIVVSYPENGVLEIVDKENGKFRYTPYGSYVGEDAFTYVARDEWGNFSTPQTVNVNVSKRLTEVEFEDMKNNESYNAALTLTAMGIMDGKIVGDGVYFMPEDSLSKEEFVSMLMKTLDIKRDSTITETYFDDNEKISPALVSYVGTAQRIGLISGEFESGKLLFKPKDAISSYEAASIIRQAIGDRGKVDIPASLVSEIPVFARDDVFAMCELGIFDKEFSEISKNDTVTKEACALYLYRLLNM